jgi:DNA-binding SARP family transcriptional activator
MDSGRPQLRLLGSFQLRLGSRPVPLPMTAQRVIAFVALHEGVQRSFVAGSLWLDSPEERAHANLRSALWRIGRSGVRLVTASGQQLSLDAAVVVDIRESWTRARRALDASTTGPLDVESLVFGGDLLPDWYDEWIVLERERYRQLRLRALDTLCQELASAGRFTRALEVGLAAVGIEPLRESAHRAVIRIHLAEGNVGEAVRQYRLCRSLLFAQLGIQPSARMDKLMAGLDIHETIR